MFGHACKQYIFRSCNTSTFSAVRLDENPFTCQCEKESKTAPGFQILHFYWSFSRDFRAVKRLKCQAVVCSDLTEFIHMIILVWLLRTADSVSNFFISQNYAHDYPGMTAADSWLCIQLFIGQNYAHDFLGTTCAQMTLYPTFHQSKLCTWLSWYDCCGQPTLYPTFHQSKLCTWLSWYDCCGQLTLYQTFHQSEQKLNKLFGPIIPVRQENMYYTPKQ